MRNYPIPTAKSAPSLRHSLNFDIISPHKNVQKFRNLETFFSQRMSSQPNVSSDLVWEILSKF